VNEARVKAIALACGASAAGIAPAADLEEFERFSEAVKAAPGGLAYLSRDPLKRKNIKNWFPAAGSVLVCAFRYWEPGMDYAAELAKAGDPAAYLKKTGRKRFQPELLAAPGAKISRYALCRDYHLTVKEKLAAALEALKKEFPAVEGRIFCDTSPVTEKELARLAGLGFRGKNTLLLSRELGSYFFLGGIALDLKLEQDAPIDDSCGACDLCLKACPTGALKAGALDPALCLSYWTTQSKEKIPPQIAAKTKSWAYGCDLCQEACPHNKQ
jgi:epoxyqueuosine reductase